MTAKKTEALQKMEPQEKDGSLAVNVESLLALAIREKVDVETMRGLFELAKSIKADKAAESFQRDFTRFQAECPAIMKNKAVKKDGKTRYKFAPLDEVLKIAGPILAKYNISHSEDCEIDHATKMLTATSLLQHKDGHVKRSSFPVPIGSDYMSKQQEMGAAMSFAKRYAFVNNTGLSYFDEDTDGMSQSGEWEKEMTNKSVKAPASKSEKRDTGAKSVESDEAKRLGIRKAGSKEDMIPTASCATLKAQLKRGGKTEDLFEETFGFPMATVHKASINPVLDWIKEQQ